MSDERASSERRAKAALETSLAERQAEHAARRERRLKLAAALAEPHADRAGLQSAFDAHEASVLRSARRRMSIADFEQLKVIGRGAFGEVVVVRAREDGKL